MMVSEGSRELEGLSHRLHDQMNRMKDIKSGKAHLDTIHFNKSSKIMHKEIQSLRRMYDTEIRKLRAEIQETSSKVGKHKFTQSLLTNTSADLMRRVKLHVMENTKLDEQVSQIKGCINERVQAIDEKTHELSQHAEHLEAFPTSSSQLDKALQDSVRLKQAIEEEVELTKASEQRVKQLTEHSQFNGRIARQQEAELQQRLTATSDAILHLDRKLRDNPTPEQDGLIAEMLSAINDVSEVELSKCKQETENTFSQNISVLKSQMGSDRQSCDSVAAENRRLMSCVDDLNVKIRHLQGQLTHLDTRKRTAEDTLKVEQEGVSKQIQRINSRVDDIQDSLLEKTRELALVKCENIPLKAEAEQLRTIIRDEHERQSLEAQNSPSSHSTTMPTVCSPVANLGSQPVGKQRCTSARAVAYSESNGYPTSYHNGVSADYFSVSRCTSVKKSAGYNMRSRPHSSPANHFGAISEQRQMSSAELGQGRCYFDGLFKQKPNYEMVRSAGQAKHVRIAENPKSSLGALVIHEVSKDGRYIMLHNNSSMMDMEIGGYSLQQNLSGVPVTQFFFPKRITFRAGSFITIFAGVCSSELHQPPTQFVKTEQERWGTGPECTTVLCNSSGKAVAWINAPHRHSSGSREGHENHNQGLQIHPASRLPNNYKTPSCEGDSVSEGGSSTGPTYLKRETVQSADRSPSRNEEKSLAQTANPVTTSVSSSRHSASGLRMGSAPMRKFTPIPS